MATAKTDMRLFPPFYPPEGPERAPELEYELPDPMLQGPHIHITTQSAWENFFEIHRPDVLPPMFAYETPVYYRNRRGRIHHVVPDWFFAFDVNARAVGDRNGFFVEEVGKGPDVVFEVGSPSTYENDLGEKRRVYQRMGAGEYWGFDPTGGDYYGAPIFGWILVDGEYVEAEVEYDDETGDARGYSPTLDMYVCAIHAPDELPQPFRTDYLLRFQDRRTGQYLMTPNEALEGFWAKDAALHETEDALHETKDALHESEVARGWLESQLNIVRAARESDRTAHEMELDKERAARESAEARIKELEDRLRGYES